MAKDIIVSDVKLPAHIRAALPSTLDEDWGSGTTSGFPVISTKGKVFRIRRGDEFETLTRPDDPDEPVSSINVVILKTHQGVAKTYFEGAYEEGSDDKPTCYSSDGIAPAADAENRQSKNCATCERNKWGSRVTESGKQAKLCSDVKRLAVANPDLVNEPMLLRVPPTSLKLWDSYCGQLAKRGLTPAHVITKISFDPTVAHQLLKFKVSNFITEEMVPQIEAGLADKQLDAIIGLEGGAINPVQDEPLEEEAPPPKKKRAAKKVVAEDEGEEEEAPPPKKKRPAKKAAKVVEPEDDLEDSDDDDDDDFDDIDFGDLNFDDDDDD